MYTVRGDEEPWLVNYIVKIRSDFRTKMCIFVMQNC